MVHLHSITIHVCTSHYLLFRSLSLTHTPTHTHTHTRTPTHTHTHTHTRTHTYTHTLSAHADAKGIMQLIRQVSPSHSFTHHAPLLYASPLSPFIYHPPPHPPHTFKPSSQYDADLGVTSGGASALGVTA